MNHTVKLRFDNPGKEHQEGTVEQFEVILKVRSNPCKADSDNDGLSDFEEVNLGKDGFITDPTLDDTDGDGLSDKEETYGIEKGVISDPTRADTDLDGVDDFHDINPAGDIAIQIKIRKIDLCSKYGNDKGKVKLSYPLTPFKRTGQREKEIR